MFAPSIAVATSGAVHVVWWSPNIGELWEQPGTRPGTSADDLAHLPEAARHGPADGGSTGADVWYARFDPSTNNWDAPERLNHAPGWHFFPHLTVDARERVWVTWASVTHQENYGNLTSDIPYIQTSRARARRAMWFRGARPVVRVRQPDGAWSVVKQLTDPTAC